MKKIIIFGILLLAIAVFTIKINKPSPKNIVIPQLSTINKSSTTTSTNPASNDYRCQTDVDCTHLNKDWCFMEECLKITTPPTKATENGWRKYSNAEARFEITFPPSWKIGYVDKGSDYENAPLTEISKKTLLLGKEGWIELLWGSGFGGGCEKWETQQIQNETLPVCHTTNVDGSEQWRQMSKKQGGFSFVMNSYAYPPNSDNRNTIITIMSSLKFF